MGYMFCLVPVIVQHVLLPEGPEHVSMVVALLVVMLPAILFIMYYFDKWTPRVLYMLLPVAVIVIAINMGLFSWSLGLLEPGASTSESVFVMGNITCVVVNFACAAAARSTRENILLFWNINEPVKEKPALYIAIMIVAGMIAACIVEWRLVYVVATMLAGVLPVLLVKIQQAMKTRLAIDPGVETRHMNAFTTPVFTRSAFLHVAEKIFLAFFFTFPIVFLVSNPMTRACVDLLLPGGPTTPLSSALLVYILGFLAIGGPILVLFWWLFRRYHADPLVREKIAVTCTLVTIPQMIIQAIVAGAGDVLPAPVYLAWAFVGSAFLAMELLYIFLIIHDLLPSKRVAFLGQCLPIIIVTMFFLWIYPVMDMLGTTTMFLIPGILSACVLLAYFSIMLRVREKKVRAVATRE